MGVCCVDVPMVVSKFVVSVVGVLRNVFKGMLIAVRGGSTFFPCDITPCNAAGQLLKSCWIGEPRS